MMSVGEAKGINLKSFLPFALSIVFLNLCITVAQKETLLGRVHRNSSKGTALASSTHLPSFLCNGSSITAQYERTSLTPRLVLRMQKNNATCAILKLSCRLRSNIRTVDIRDEGLAKKRLPVRDWAWGEILSSNLMRLSPIAAGVTIPSTGAVIPSAQSLFNGLQHLQSIPMSCWWPGNTLAGFAMSFLDGLTNGRIENDNIHTLSESSKISIAVIWVLDALILNSNRSPKKNIYEQNFELVPLDFEKWFQDSAADISCGHSHEGVRVNHNIAHFIHNPKILGKLRPCSEEAKPLLMYAIRILTDWCGKYFIDGQCIDLKGRLKKFLVNDPWFMYVTEETTKHSLQYEYLCCDGYTGGPFQRTCTSCLSNSAFKAVFQKSLDGACQRMYHSSAPVDILVDIVSRRVYAAYNAILEVYKHCEKL